MNALPLAGKRIVVTRAVHQAGELVAALCGLGATIVELPVIEIAPPASYQPLDDALRHLDVYQWLIVTSANTVSVLAERARVVPVDLSKLGCTRTVSIGAATAAAMREQGIPVHLVPEKYVAEALVDAMQTVAHGARILLARASVARDVIPERLRSLGALLDVVDAYQNVIPVAAEARIHELFGDPRNVPDAVTFTSSSTVKNFVVLLQKAGIALPLHGVFAVSIGVITSATLRECGWEPAAEAEPSDVAGLVAAAVRALSP